MKWMTVAFCVLVFSHAALAQLKHESEYSLLQSGGNSEVNSQNAKTSNIYTWEKNQLRFGGHYTYGEAKNVVSARNWDGNLKYERQLSSKLSFITGEVVEGNRFTNIEARYNSDAGFKYYYLKSDLHTFFSELSYRYTIENRYAPTEDLYDQKARFYNELAHKYSPTVQYKFWLEYIPNFTDGKDYLVNGEASVTSILSSIFSLKVAYMGMYDNKPTLPTLKNYDFATTTSLVAKF